MSKLKSSLSRSGWTFLISDGFVYISSIYLLISVYYLGLFRLLERFMLCAGTLLKICIERYENFVAVCRRPKQLLQVSSARTSFYLGRHCIRQQSLKLLVFKGLETALESFTLCKKGWTCNGCILKCRKWPWVLIKFPVIKSAHVLLTLTPTLGKFIEDS